MIHIHLKRLTQKHMFLQMGGLPLSFGIYIYIYIYIYHPTSHTLAAGTPNSEYKRALTRKRHFSFITSVSTDQFLEPCDAPPRPVPIAPFAAEPPPTGFAAKIIRGGERIGGGEE
jgi:hypothetical protein